MHPAAVRLFFRKEKAGCEKKGVSGRITFFHPVAFLFWATCPFLFGKEKGAAGTGRSGFDFRPPLFSTNALLKRNKKR